MRFVGLTLALLALAACRGTRAPGSFVVQSYGTMREVLKGGHSQGRVSLDGLARDGAVGVGALADLGGEVTIVDGHVLVAVVEGERCIVRKPSVDAAATLLVRAEVDRWQRQRLADCASYAELEGAIGVLLAKRGFDRNRPTPVRIRGRAPHVEFHVIAGACPIANPSGPAPWRFAGPLDEVELVGIYVEGAAGRWTHHRRRSHLHVVAAGRMGHLDAIRIEDVEVQLPAEPRPSSR